MARVYRCVWSRESDELCEAGFVQQGDELPQEDGDGLDTSVTERGTKVALLR